MFTGLIQCLGSLDHVRPLDNGAQWTITATESFLSDCQLGDSIAINGVCSTVTAIDGATFTVDYLPETLAKTTFKELKPGASLNLEQSLTLSTKLGGHIVSGHIDETCKILDIRKGDPFWEIDIQINPNNAANLVPKGSIAMDGISLTVGNLTPETFSCFIIPHTIEHTNLQYKAAGDTLNIEYDMLGKYVLRQQDLNAS